MASGGCHCGGVRYSVAGEMMHHAVCHCEDCRKNAGAPMVAWIAFPKNALSLDGGSPQVYNSSEHGRRHFCGECGTGLFYYNEVVLPGIVDIQSVTLDDVGERTPQAHIQMADALPWEASLGELPKFDRYPGP